MLHNVGGIEEVEYEINNQFSTEITTNNDVLHCHANSLLFIQPDINSLIDRLSTSSETVLIPNMWILLDSQSTIDVF